MLTKPVLGAIGVALFVGGGLVGRLSLPARVEYVNEKTHTETVKETTHIHQEVDLALLMKQLSDVAEKKNVVTKKTTTREPSGKEIVVEEVVDTSTKNTHTDTSTKTDLKLKTDLTLLTDRLTVDKEFTRQVTSRRPDWVVGGQLGYSVPVLLGHSEGFSLSPVRGAVVSVSVERRVLGPLLLGLWANTRGDVGVGVRLELQ